MYVFDSKIISTDSFLLFLTTVGSQMLRPALNYIIGASFFYFLFWFFLKNFFKKRKIQSRENFWYHYARDFANSTLNVCTIGILSLFLVYLLHSSKHKIYNDWDEYGWLYAVFSFIVANIALDTYYYWLHRLLHLPWFFKYVHSVHHLSRSPTPWSTFAIAPLEQALVYLFYINLVCLLPMHKMVFSFFVFVGLIRQYVGHLGYEVFPKNTLKKRFLKWNLTVTHHDMHHQYISCNYGLYFSFWDKVMKTNHPQYEKRFLSL